MDQRYFRGVSLVGTIEVLETAEAKETIWQVGDEMFYKEGVSAPDYCVLKFTAYKGRYYSNFKPEDFDIWCRILGIHDRKNKLQFVGLFGETPLPL